MKSDINLTDDHFDAIINFIQSILTSEGRIKSDLTTKEVVSLSKRMLSKFDHTVVDSCAIKRKDDEYEVLKKITLAIRTLNRLNMRPSVKNITKIVRKNRWTVRQIMVEHGLYDPETKKVINKFDDDIGFIKGE